MKRRKIWSILALAALTGSLLAGCGEVKTEEQTKGSVSCTSLKQKKVDLIDQPLSLHSTYSVVTSIS